MTLETVLCDAALTFDSGKIEAQTFMKKLLPKIIFASLGLLLVIAGFSYFYYQTAVNRKNYDGQGMAEFTITPGQRVWEIADNLRRARLINSASAFKIYVKVNSLGAKLQAGYYRIPRDLSLADLVDILQHGKFDLKLTFPEGWRREEMANSAARELGRNSFYNEFLKESQNDEGYLFPETYIVPRDITAKDLVKVMRETFDKKYLEAFNAAGSKTKLSEKEVVTLASIVEREARKDEDRPVVAGILIKRLKAGWPLQVDATIQYAQASRKLASVSTDNLQNFDFWPEVTGDGLKIDSPFNTYLRKGLPASPISNPGVAAISSVLKAIETPYWFYLTGTDGVTRYAVTAAQHQVNINQYLRQP